MKKRGTHVGVILSFLIFVTFLAFLYSITEPVTRVSRDKLDLLEYLKVELVNKFSEDISTITITLKDTSGSCKRFENFNGLADLGAVIKDNEGGVIPSYIEPNGVAIVSSIPTDIMKFYYSNQFDRGEDVFGECLELVEEVDYNISIFRTTDEVFARKIISISESIRDTPGYYGDLKEELGVAFDDEFGFTFFNGDKEILEGTEEKNVSVDVYAEEIPIQYLDNKANINPGFLTIRVW